jgi:mono/diheme cytochrome c family protein
LLLQEGRNESASYGYLYAYCYYCLVWMSKHSMNAGAKPSESAYGKELDWNNPQQPIPLNYRQSQGQRIFYNNCVWCHADSTPAGPSNRANLTPSPALANDGATLNSLSDEYLQNIITLGGSALSKSAMMPPWGKTLKQEDIRAVVAFMRAIAQPPYRPSVRPASQYSEK